MADGKSGSGKGSELALARVEMKRALAQTTNANKRLDLILSHPKCELLVPTLPAEDLYFTIKEVGMSDALELVRMASPDQFRSFLDLDSWKRDHFSHEAALTWLRAAGTDEDEERFRKKIHNLDMELLELVLFHTTRVYDLEEDPDCNPQGATYESPEGRYLVEFLVEGTAYLGIKRLMDELYAEDPFRTARLLEAVRWETPTELEESAFRWRSARVQDLGFPELSEALSYFAWIDPDAAVPAMATAPHVPDSFFLTRYEPAGRFFDRAVALVAEELRGVLERQLVTVLNAVMVVEEVEPGEMDQVQRALTTARDTLSLGLEYAAKADPEAAAALLVSRPLKRIFQIGVSLALRLKYRADRLLKAGKASLPGSKDQPLLDRPLDTVILGLRRKRPSYAVALEEATAPEEKLRSFADCADVARVATALADSEQCVEVMAKLGFDPKAAAEQAEKTRPAEALSTLRFSDFLITATARELVGLAYSFEPLPKDKLTEFAAKAFALEAGCPGLNAQTRASLSRISKAGHELSVEHGRAAVALEQLVVARLLEDVGRPWALGALGPEDPLPLLLAH